LTSLDQIDIVLESTDTYIAYIAYEGKPPRRYKGKYNRKNCLGYLEYSWLDRVLEVVNKNVALDRKVWYLGETNKEGGDYYAGGHGLQLTQHNPLIAQGRE
jgi:hypothetical protein